MTEDARRRAEEIVQRANHTSEDPTSVVCRPCLVDGLADAVAAARREEREWWLSRGPAMARLQALRAGGPTEGTNE